MPTSIGNVSEAGRYHAADPRRDPLPMESTLTALTEATFEEEINAADQPVLVYFWAEWCGRCKLINPILGVLATEYGGRLRIVKVSVDESPAGGRRVGFISHPTQALLQMSG